MTQSHKSAPTHAHHAQPAAKKPAPAKGGHAVSITAEGFSPESVDLVVGDTVTWTNDDAVPRNVTFDATPALSMDVAVGDSVSHTVTAPGEHAYHCKDHPEMKGKLVVKEK